MWIIVRILSQLDTWQKENTLTNHLTAGGISCHQPRWNPCLLLLYLLSIFALWNYHNKASIIADFIQLPKTWGTTITRLPSLPTSFNCPKPGGGDLAFELTWSSDACLAFEFICSSDVCCSSSQVQLPSTGTKVKEYAWAEGVLAELGVALESVIDLSCENRVSEMAEYCEKVLRTSARPHVDLVPGGNGTGTCLKRADTWQQGTCLRSLVSTHFCGSFHHFF